MVLESPYAWREYDEESEEFAASYALPDAGRKTPEAARNIVGPLLEAEITFLRQIVRRWHQKGADADDLIQDTITRAFASAHLWEPGTSLRAWLLTIMRNQFLRNRVRHRRMQSALAFADVSGGWVAADPDLRLTLRDVERALRRLPERQRDAVLLAGVKGKTYNEAAVEMGVTVDAVRCHLGRARDRLRGAVNRKEDRSWLNRAPGR